jgi:hypothetical protein
MAGRPKGLPKTGGRQPGSPNKTTLDVREAIAAFASANVGQMSEWLDAIEDPAKKMDLYLRAIEYHIPKLGRTELTGDPKNPVSITIKGA